MLLLELGNDVLDDALVEVLAAEECVAVGGQHFELLLAIDIGDLDDRHVEGAATQVIDGNLAVALFVLVEAEGECCRCWLIDDALDIQPGDAASVLRRLTLRVVEVCGHGDDGFGDRFAQIVLGGLLHLAQDFGADLLRSDLVAAHLNPRIAVVGSSDLVGHQIDVLLHFLLGEFAADQALHRVQRVLGVGDGLTLRRGADEDLAAVLVGHDRRCGARTFAVLDHLGGVAFHDRHA